MSGKGECDKEDQDFEVPAPRKRRHFHGNYSAVQVSTKSSQKVGRGGKGGGLSDGVNGRCGNVTGIRGCDCITRQVRA